MHEEDDIEGSKGHHDVIAEVGTYGTGRGRVEVSVTAWVDEKGARLAPAIRVMRVTEKKGEEKRKTLTSYKAGAEAIGVAALLVQASPLLDAAIKS